MWNHLYNRRSGQILVVLAVAVLVLIGFLALVVELGRLEAAKQNISEAALAGALAAGARLPNRETGTRAARTVCLANGADTVTVDYPDERRVSLTCSQRMPFFFAGMWGLRSTRVRARTTVTQTAPVTSVSSVLRPLAVPASTYTRSRWLQLTLAVLPRDRRALSRRGARRFVALSPGGTSILTYVREFVTNMEEGYRGTVAVGDRVESPRQSMRQAIVTAVVRDSRTERALFQQARRAPYSDRGTTYSYPNYPYGDPRIVIVALGSRFGGGSSRRQVTIAGFAAFYLQSVSRDGNRLRGRFLEYSLSPGHATSASQTDYGLRTYYLTD